ncbi:MAG: hypothetical protein M1401_13635 [Chloroflexi bacterium]|nr:hypothetical protein [Bacteroidota bacterium]MCL5109878.1 hypothetical protein [Chloroflexota bacterium]
MSATLPEAPSPHAPPHPTDWPRLLRQVCEVLGRTPEGAIPVLSVRAPLDGNPATWGSIQLLAQQLARRYGLHCSSTFSREFAEVTFSRQAAGD